MKGADQVYAYCLFCDTLRCRTIATELSRIPGCICICPQIIQYKWVQGRPTEEIHDWLPGYLFLYTEEETDLYLIRQKVSGIIRYLGEAETHFQLNGEDLRFATMLRENGGVLGKVTLAEIGDRVHVKDPVWENLHGTVVKLDRHRKRCCVSFPFDGKERNVWVGYEMVERE